jgi:3'-phosphoadenosine 5'-phosphosulfate sulfotransferase (PAPS reductase)/FAD synthetase
MASKKLIESTLAALDFCLKGRDDFFVTTSFGYQSSLLFFLMAELGVPVKCLYIRSSLSEHGVDEQMDYAIKKFDFDLDVVDRSHWLEDQLQGREFLTLDQGSRKTICKNLKREPLLEYIKSNALKIWISGIRRDQTEARGTVRFMSVTDLSVIKLSPLFDWSDLEVKNLIIENNLRVNADYFDLCKLNEVKECGLHF